MYSFAKKCTAFVFVLLLLSLASCSVKVDEAENIYSRQHVEAMCSNNGFGKGNEDELYVALNYIYTNEELKQKYGDDFEVTDVQGSAEWGSRLGSIYKGTASYAIVIESDEWIVKLNKEYFGKWQVIECHNNSDSN